MAEDTLIDFYPTPESLIEKLADGLKLRCLVNAETLRKTHTNLRKSLVSRLETLWTEIEYLTGELESAERQTSVEVALIKALVERPKPVSIILESPKPGAAL